MMSKQELREQFLQQRRELPREEKMIRDRRITSRLIDSACFRKAEWIACYVSLPREVDTMPILRAALESGKRLCVPCSNEETCTLTFREIRSLDDFLKGPYGILEPNPRTCREVESFPSGTLCIVPGLAFDRQGYRLGYGKGYFDRFLDKFHGLSVGLCHTAFLTETLPHEEHDLPVKKLFTEANTIIMKR